MKTLQEAVNLVLADKKRQEEEDKRKKEERLRWEEYCKARAVRLFVELVIAQEGIETPSWMWTPNGTYENGYRFFLHQPTAHLNHAQEIKKSPSSTLPHVHTRDTFKLVDAADEDGSIPKLTPLGYTPKEEPWAAFVDDSYYDYTETLAEACVFAGIVEDLD